MVYKFAPDENYGDFAGGRVLYHKGGMPSFPVRLGNEIFRRCIDYCDKDTGLCLYDPCCGGGYLLAVLGFLNGEAIGEIIGSDIDGQALSLAGDNLSLLTPEGLSRRRRQLEELAAQYGKPSHNEALLSLDRLKALANRQPKPLAIQTFRANILNKEALAAAGFQADIILADVPYGKMTAWSEKDGEGSFLDGLLQGLRPVRGEKTITAVISDKSQRFQAKKVYRLDKFNAGKRKVEIFRG